MAGGPSCRARHRPWPRAAGQLLKFHPVCGLNCLPRTVCGLDCLPRKAVGLTVMRDTGPGRAWQVSSSRSIQHVGWTICLGRRAGLAIVRDAGPGRARLVSSSRSIQPVGWTVCLGQRVGLAVVRNAGPVRALQVSSSSSIQPVGWTVCLRQRESLAVSRDAGPCCTRWVSSSSSILPLGWTICLGLQAGLAVVRDAGPGRARLVSSSSTIQPVGWTVCLGLLAGLSAACYTDSFSGWQERGYAWPSTLSVVFRCSPSLEQGQVQPSRQSRGCSTLLGYAATVGSGQALGLVHTPTGYCLPVLFSPLWVSPAPFSCLLACMPLSPFFQPWGLPEARKSFWQPCPAA